MSTISLTRLNKEYENLTKDPPDNFVAFPIKDDMFCWHFTIRGPEDSEFEGGLYHGVIKLPTSYPHKPPNVMFLTPNGRFDTNIDICLSMTKYHKEEWQAAWTIRSMLEAIIAFMPIKEDHEAIGAVDLPTDIRKKYAVLSVKYQCDTCGPIVNLIPEKPKAKPPVKEDKKIEKEKKNDDKEDEEQAHSTSSSKNKKKIDQHQRIKGVIVEDSHEDDIDEENKLKKSSHLSNQKTKITKEADNITKIDEVSDKSKKDDKETVNFIEFFKRIRMDQYQNNNTSSASDQPIPQSNLNNQNNDLDEEIVPNKKSKVPIETNEEVKKNKPTIQEIPAKETKKFDEKTQILIDELEFQHLSGTIKLFNTKSNEEIISILKKEGNEEKRKPKETQRETIDHCAAQLLSNQKELEKLLKKQVRDMKSYSKLLYEQAHKKRIRIINCILTVLLIITFGYFWGIKKMK